MKLVIEMLKIVLYIVAFIHGEKYKYSQEYEDNFKTMDLGEKLWWAYKALIRQIEAAEKGKGIEGYFAAQDLDFKSGESFHEETRIEITAGGDLSCSDVITPESTEHLWEDVEEFFFSGDIACANLEAPIDSSKPAGVVPSVCLTAPELNMTPELFERFVHGGKGVNFFSTANNHSLDQGESGLVATLDFLDAAGYRHVGTSRTACEQADIPVIEKNGIRVAFLSYTYCLNRYDPIPGKEYMTNMIRLNKPDSEISMIRDHVAEAHRKKADIVVAMLHWSVEFEAYPIENVITMGHRVMECGVDVILGGHPHVAQPMEKYRFRDPVSGLEKEGFIVYSLGELVSYNAFSKNSRLALLVKIGISKGMDRKGKCMKITGVKVLPIFTLIRKLKNGRWDYRVLNFMKTLALLRKGINPFGFDKKERKELERLEKLLLEKLLPANKQEVLIEADIEGIRKCS